MLPSNFVEGFQLTQDHRGYRAMRLFLVTVDEVARHNRLFADARRARVLAVETGSVGAACEIGVEVFGVKIMLAGAGATVSAVVVALSIVVASVAKSIADAHSLQ